jgi:phage terminase large subunit-like protein
LTTVVPEIILPERTLEPLVAPYPMSLGFGVAKWIEDWLLQPDGPNAGDPYKLTRDQLVFIIRWYQVDYVGRFVYRQGMKVDAKGKGKSILAAAILLAEFLGPVRFSHFETPGGNKPVGVAHSTPWVVLAALSESQTKNTYAAILGMIDGSAVVDEYQIDVGKSRLLVPGGGMLTPITAGSRTQEGARPTATLIDEVHHLTDTNGGVGLFEVLRRNAAKARDGASRVLMTTNGWAPGEDSVAERVHFAWTAQQESRSPKKDILLDMASAPMTVDISDIDQLRAALRGIYHDAPWIDIETLLGEVLDPSTPVEVSRRFYLGQIVASAEAWTSLQDYDACAAPLGTRPLTPGDTVVLGFDGSLTDDSTALVVMRCEDQCVFLFGLWEAPVGPTAANWRVDQADVDETVHKAFADYDVVAFFSDVAYWESFVENWATTYADRLLVSATTRSAVGYDMRGHLYDLTRAAEAMQAAIESGTFLQWPDRRMRRHFANARRRLNRYGISFGKTSRESKDKVDVVAATMLARMACQLIFSKQALEKRKPQRTGVVVAF